MLEALEGPEGALADDAAGDCDRSITVAAVSSESEDRPEGCFRTEDAAEAFDLDPLNDRDNELILAALRSAIFLRMRSCNGSWYGGGSEVEAFLSAAACQI